MGNFFALFFFFSGAAHATPAEPSKIITGNMLTSVKADGSNVDLQLKPYLDAFGLIHNGHGTCSGTHLGNGYVVSAGHCFFDQLHIGPKVAQNQPCSSVKVNWGYRGSPQTGSPKPLVTLSSQCVQIVYAEVTPQSDFAIFRVDHAPKIQIDLARESDRTPVGTKITLFGYPRARPLEWSQYCGILSTTTAGLDTTKGQSTFVYTCDTEPGNSGSSILAFTKSGQLKVVGIHDGAAPSGINFNYATYVFDARATLLSKGFDLDRAVVSGGM